MPNSLISPTDYILQVMVQPHNRQLGMSWYLASIAVADSLVLTVGKLIITIVDYVTISRKCLLYAMNEQGLLPLMLAVAR